jgi:hypothetical protein
MAEFVSLLYLPVEKSFKVLQDKLQQMADEGKLPDKSKDYYRMWIKILEGHYMTLFKSPDYVHTVAKTLDAMGEFWIARRQLLQDALQMLPVSTHRDMDELYKEIYLLKKRLKGLEKYEEKVGDDHRKSDELDSGILVERG